jgi:predicted site-specific integrase-resolvase
MNTPGKFSFAPSPERIYSTGEMAEEAGVTAITVFRWIEKGKIKADFCWFMKNNRGKKTERYFFVESTFRQMLREMGK